MSEPLFTIKYSDSTYGLDAAREIATRTGGKVVEGPFHAFVAAKDGATLDKQPKGDVVYREASFSFSGNPDLLNGDKSVVEATKRLNDPKRQTANLITDDPKKLRDLIERETGLILGPRLEETGSAGVSGDHNDGTSSELYMLSTKPELIKKSEPIGCVEITRMTRQQLDAERTKGTLSQGFKFDIRDK